MISALFLAATAIQTASAAYNNASSSAVSAEKVVIQCPKSTDLIYGTSTYTVTEPTVLTVENCFCTDNNKVGAVPFTPVPATTTGSHSWKSAPVSATGAHSSSASSEVTSTTTVNTTNIVHIPCNTPTTLSYGSSTYTITEATTLTVEDCSCTDNSKVSAVPATPTPTPASSTEVASTTANTDTTSTSTIKTTNVVHIPCSTPTTVSYAGSTYTVTAATTLVVSDCSCHDNTRLSVTTPPPSTPETKSAAPTVKSTSTAPEVSAVEVSTSKAASATYVSTEVAPASHTASASTSAPALASAASSSGPALANAAPNMQIGAFAGVLAAVAYLI